MAGWEDISGINRGYVLELYERFRKDPSSVDPETRAMFERWTPPPDIQAETPAESEIPVRAAVSAVNLAQSIRRYGHLAAQLDPLGTKPPGDPTLLAERHGITEEHLRRIPASLVSSPLDRKSTRLNSSH